jgi:hypothetical protein
MADVRQLLRPNGFTAEETRHLAVAFAGIVAGHGGDPDELTAVLHATGLLYDPDQLSPAHLGDPRTHPFGRRDEPTLSPARS